VKKFALAFAAIPILGWLLSLLWNWWGFGTPFATGEWTNLPLICLTLPCLHLWERLGGSRLLMHHPHVVMLLYTLLCAALYFLAGIVVGVGTRQVVLIFRRAR
jgi:hypothetical protein